MGSQKNLSTFQGVGEIALDRSCPQPPTLDSQAGAALAGPDSCRDRHNVGVAVTGGAKAGPGRAARRAEPDTAPGCAQLSKGLRDSSLILLFLLKLSE